MKNNPFVSLLFLVPIALGTGFTCYAQKPIAAKHTARHDSASRSGDKPSSNSQNGWQKTNDSVPPPVVTHHHITIDGKTINYTATAGYMPIKDADEKLMAKIFYIAYVADVESADKRPITFVFNGGPGSSSIWLHMGAISPVRVHF